MAVIPLPTIAKFDDLQWTPMFRNQANKSPWTGVRKVMGLPGGEHFAVSCSPREAMTETAERQWRGFIMQLRGVENHFLIKAACNQFPSATANPTVSSALAGNSFATLNGVPAGGMKYGMFMSIPLTDGTRQLVVVTGDTAAGNGVVVPFEPSLRKNGTGSVEVKSPAAEVAMTKDNTGWSKSQGRFMVAFEAEEAWGQ